MPLMTPPTKLSKLFSLIMILLSCRWNIRLLSLLELTIQYYFPFFTAVTGLLLASQLSTNFSLVTLIFECAVFKSIGVAVSAIFIFDFWYLILLCECFFDDCVLRRFCKSADHRYYYKRNNHRDACCNRRQSSVFFWIHII